eukprot:2436624-Amphidinium_carterae.2
MPPALITKRTEKKKQCNGDPLLADCSHLGGLHFMCVSCLKRQACGLSCLSAQSLGKRELEATNLVRS